MALPLSFWALMFDIPVLVSIKYWKADFSGKLFLRVIADMLDEYDTYVFGKQQLFFILLMTSFNYWDRKS